ncbi:hypothetical protein [Mycobacterium helveticum]|uniref:Uncharacterized protein n=1 Tax=Mycobacterium helveticum TaxID=2592811 RepID=A0A557XXX5_9MYCO|nr:hypothetical protein [Mycobacterium helveticum]TVS86969.1 hypothetical protein FPZ46_09670 [Mycobacterium helveticum]TVS90999.1 hypothetical protein FPZ47_07085 [Mycobacterium helveticum]
MTVARSVSDVLSDHVRFEVECIDRMYCNVYVPQLQFAAGLIGYIQRQMGLPIASTGVSFHLCKSGVVHHRTAVGRSRRSVL